MEEESSHHKDSDSQQLDQLIESIVGDKAFRVEEDFGGGFVRLKNSEAELRQAAQDIRSTEDVVIELLRNSRDAGSKNIYLAFRKESGKRYLTVIDDGSGIPSFMHERIFQPRVTSKLDTARFDRWGMHGRGMALYSIYENSEVAKVLMSSVGLGSSIEVITDTEKLSEKTDQSTFPRFEVTDGVYAMRGPKNVFRMVAEFALEEKSNISVYCGSETEIVAALYERGMKNIPPSKRIFDRNVEDVAVTDLLGMATDTQMLSDISEQLGIGISERSARRIMDRQILPPQDMLARIADESFESKNDSKQKASDESKDTGIVSSPFRPKISKEDVSKLTEKIERNFEEVGESYYLSFDRPKIVQRKDKIVVEIPFLD